jgi:hypothetical protein|tara:strand:- start:1854 stop:2039 length:186 start_codon:yes stop_codon:yes gene_type:complete
MFKIKRAQQYNQESNYPISENDYTALRFLAREILRCIVEKKDIRVIKNKVYLLLNVAKNFK